MTRSGVQVLDYASSRDNAARPLRVRAINAWFLFLAITLAGYVVDGRGFAYIGIPPLFIGEILLISGVVVLLCCGYLREMLDMPLTWVLLAFCAWGAARTVPYLGVWGIDAVRDAVVWGYAVFALIVGGLLIAEPFWLGELMDRYARAIGWLLGLLVLFNILYRAVAVPFSVFWPWADSVLVFHQKEGDVLVHLAGILLCWSTVFSRRPSWGLISLWAMNTAINALIDRAGSLSVAAALGLCLLARSASTIPWRIAMICITAFALLWATDLRIALPMSKGRDIAFDQILHNIESIIGSSEHGDLDGTKEWRLDWWGKIADYTISGPYFWSGKGFGVNLADDDGFQVGDMKLRSPHNIHMTILARMGVPGAFLWAVATLGWALAIAWNFIVAEMRGRRRWADLFLFVGGYWLALLINAAFDVALEGPMGGVWFWSLYGMGLAAMWLHARRPEVLDPPPEVVSEGDLAATAQEPTAVA